MVLSGGEPVLYVERGGKTLLSWSDDQAVLEPCAAALAAAVRDGALGRITVEKADGETVHDSPLAARPGVGGLPPHPAGAAPARRPAGRAPTALRFYAASTPPHI